MDSNLQVRFGTKRTYFKVKFFQITMEPVPATMDNDPLAIQTLDFSEQGL